MNRKNLKNLFHISQRHNSGVTRKEVAFVLILLYSFSVFAFLLTPAAVASSQSTTVYGTVTDEAGNGLSGVAVTVSGSTGAQLLTTYTDSYGDIVINNLAFGTYNIILNKVGYAQLIQSVMINTFGQQLGTIVLSPALNLTTSILSQVTNPGGEAMFPLSLKNSGGETVTANISVSAPEGWVANVMNTNVQVASLSLSSGQNIELQLDVTVPSTALSNKEYNISVTASSGTTNSSLTFTVFVSAPSTGNVSGVVVDQSGNGINGVAVSVYDQTGHLIQKAQTSSNGYFSVSLPISTPLSLKLSKDGYVNFTTDVNLSYQSQTVDLGQITLSALLQLTSSVVSTAINSGGTAMLPFSLINGESSSQAVTFLLSSPSGWSVTILDSEGHVLTGALLSSMATSSFQLEAMVPLGSEGNYNLTLSAVGETTSTLTFNVSVGSSSVSLLSCQFPGLSVSPGDSANFAVSLTNPFGVATRFKVWVDSVPSNWTASVETSAGSSVTEILLNAGQTANLIVNVQSSSGATVGDTYGVVLEAEPVGQTVSSSLQLEVSLTAASSVSLLSCQFPGLSVSPGDSANFAVSLTNPFGVATRFKVWVDSVPSNWTASVKASTGGVVTEILLNAGQSVNLEIQVGTSASSSTGQTYGLTVNAESEEYNLTGSIPVTVALAEASNEVTLTAALPEIAITAGNAADYSVTVANLGVVDRLLFLSADVPNDWTVVFKSGATEVTSLYLYSGNTSALTLVVTPPSTVSVGSYIVPIQVKSETGVVMDTLNLTTTVTGSYNITLNLSTYLTSATSGGTASFTATITNSGYSTLTDVVVDVTLPESDWQDTVTPVQVGTLGPKESATFTVVITTSSSTVSGDYMVTVTGSSNQVSSDSTQVRVTVSTSTSWGIYGVGIAVAFIIALVLVFRKFKRR